MHWYLKSTIVISTWNHILSWAWKYCHLWLAALISNDFEAHIDFLNNLPIFGMQMRSLSPGQVKCENPDLVKSSAG